MACDTPFLVMDKDGFRKIPVPCGRCPSCKKRRVDAWVFRLMQEDKVSASAHFVTLTYDVEHVPISGNGFMTLDRSEFPRYMKRLRKLCCDVKLKYYACGEYGSKNLRPHYHAIIFNVPDDELFFKAWSLDGVPFGSVHVGMVSGDSVAYTMKYIDKTSSLGKFSKHSRDDRVPEFALMSKGLGSSYITESIKLYHKADLSRNYLVKDGGFKIALPRYYRDRIFNEEDIAEQSVLINESVSKKDSSMFREFQRLYGHRSDYSYADYVTASRKARDISFYKNQKLRDV